MDTLRQMNLAMAHIESHLEGEIDCKRLSQIAGCSEYHFRRVFSYLAGMPVGEYIRRRRLAAAALALQSGDEKIIDIALRFGFESPDTFSKAFRALFSVTPTQARQGGVALKAFLPMTFRMKIEGGNPMDYRIETKPAFKIAGKSRRITLVYSGVNPQVGQLLESFSLEDFARLKQLSNIEPGGIICASVNFSDDRQEGSELDQYVGVATTLDVPDEWETLAVESSAWAVFTAVGPFPDALQQTWGRIYSEWLPASDFEVSAGPEILRNESPDTTKPDYKSEIWIPIVKKG